MVGIICWKCIDLKRPCYCLQHLILANLLLSVMVYFSFQGTIDLSETGFFCSFIELKSYLQTFRCLFHLAKEKSVTAKKFHLSRFQNHLQLRHDIWIYPLSCKFDRIIFSVTFFFVYEMLICLRLWNSLGCTFHGW